MWGTFGYMIRESVYDFILNPDNEPLIVELSYGYSYEAYDACPGYWDQELVWHNGKTIKEEWMVESIINDN